MSLVAVGISGWNYKEWRGTFYPPELPHKEELFFASRKLPSIEINRTFYGLQRPSSYLRWYEATPPGFIFSIKAYCYISHIKKLNAVEEAMANFFASGPLALREKLGPFLWQFPPSMSFDPERFETFLKLLPKDYKGAIRHGRKSSLPPEKTWLHSANNRPLRHAIEFRNNTFLNPWFPELLRKYNVAIVFADTAGRWPYLEDITADFVYVRLHGDSELYTSEYDDETLDFWSKRIKLWKKGLEPRDRLTLTDERPLVIERDVYVYFDNDAKARAPANAKSLLQRLT